MFLRLSSIFIIAFTINVFIVKSNSFIQYSSEILDNLPTYESEEESDQEGELAHVNTPNSEDLTNGTINSVVSNSTDSLDQSEGSNIENTELSNSTDITNSTSTSNATFHVSCLVNKTFSGFPIEIVNSSRLVLLLQVEPNITNRQTPGKCITVFFYSPSCPFSCMAAPHFNALPRVFPDIKMVAVDAMTYRSFNAQYGIVGVPTVMLFHNGRPAAKFNDTSDYSLEMFSKFMTKYTGLEPDGKLVVTSADFTGPISSVPVKERDYYLILSWIVIAARLLYLFYRSSWGHWLIDATLNAWREAEAQHHHAD